MGKGISYTKRRKKSHFKRLTVEDTAAGHGSSPYLKCMENFLREQSEKRVSGADSGNGICDVCDLAALAYL